MDSMARPLVKHLQLLYAVGRRWILNHDSVFRDGNWTLQGCSWEKPAKL